jgi:hypothetical protein
MAADNSNRSKFTVLANGFRIKGHGSVIPGARVTDYLNSAEDFIALTNADVWEIGSGRKLMSAPFITINRSNVEIVIPDEAPAV